MSAILDVSNAAKTFTMHLQGGVELPVVRGVSFQVNPGECVVLSGPSGAGKSSILKMIFGNYRCDGGRIGVRHEGALIDLAGAEPLVERGEDREIARGKARALLAQLNLPEKLWALPPATFSGGEQQRVNIARGFISDLPILLLDEPTASLDAANRAVVVGLIGEKKRRGVALVAIVHDDEIRQLIADRIVDVALFAAAA